jgi:prepilin-type N-terminal cleavage/methylation domain-containing protein
MSSSKCNNRGVTLIESVIAILLVSIGLLGLLSMQPSALQTTARTDYVGRAAMMLHKELTAQELRIMNPCNAVAAGTVTVSRNLYTSGQEAVQAGDIGFIVQTVTTGIAANMWRVTVTVSVPPPNTADIKDITGSIVVTRQEPFRFGGC